MAGGIEEEVEGVWDWHALSGYVYRSPGWYRMLDYDPDTLPNTVFTWESVIHPEDYPRVMAHFDDYLHNRTPAYRIEYRCRTGGGGWRWIEDRARIIERDGDGRVVRMIGAHRDVPAHKRTQPSAAATPVPQAPGGPGHCGIVTGRQQVLAYLEAEQARAVRFRQPLSLLLLCLDEPPAQDSAVPVPLACHLPERMQLAHWSDHCLMAVLPDTVLDTAHTIGKHLLASVPGMHTLVPAQLQDGESAVQLIERAEQGLAEPFRAALLDR